MNLSTLLTGNKVSFSVVDINCTMYLVCINDVRYTTVIFVENLTTGKRAFPTVPYNIQNGSDLENLVKELASQLR